MTITLVGKFFELNEIKFKSPDKGERVVYQIVITHDSHPQYGEKRVCFSVKPEMVKAINGMAQAGMMMAFDCDLNAKDYTDASGNKRWSTDIWAFRCYPYQQMQQPMYHQPQMQYAVAPQPQMQQAVAQPYQQAQPVQPQFIPSSGYPQPQGFAAPGYPQGQGNGGNGNAPF